VLVVLVATDCVTKEVTVPPRIAPPPPPPPPPPLEPLTLGEAVGEIVRVELPSVETLTVSVPHTLEEGVVEREGAPTLVVWVALPPVGEPVT